MAQLDSNGQPLVGGQWATAPNTSKESLIAQGRMEPDVVGGVKVGDGNATTGDGTVGGDGNATRESLLKDYSTGMTVEDIRSQEAARRQRLVNEANSIFNPKIAAATETGKNQIGSTEAQFGISRGLGMSTAKLSFLNATQKDIDTRIGDIQKQKEEYVSSGNFKYAELADAQIAKMQDAKNNLILKKIDWMNEDAKNASETDYKQGMLDISTINALKDIPSGQSIVIGDKTYTGVGAADNFFKGSDIVQMMKELPEGQSKTVTDPASGKVYTIQGMASSDAGLKQFTATDDKGNLSIINYNPSTNEVLGKSVVVGAGKSKTAASSVTVNMPSYGTSVNKVYGPDGKTQIGVVRFDSKSNKTIKQDINGKEITDFPTGSTIGAPTADDGGYGGIVD